MKIVVVKCYYQQMACSQATVVYSKLFNTFFAATAIIDATNQIFGTWTKGHPLWFAKT